MKRLLKVISAVFLAVLLNAVPAVTAYATEQDFKADYFPIGKIETPEAPYFKETQYEVCVK